VFYTSQISTSALLVAGVFLLALITLNVLRVHRPLPYMLLGMGLWAGTLFSGIHATIAGVLLAFTIPVTRQFEELPYIDYQRKMLDLFAREADINPYSITEKQSYALKAMEVASQAVQTPLARVEHALLTPINFIIIPIFALANAGVDLRSGAAAAFESPIMWGVLVGLVVGKPVGVLLASWIAVKSGIASLPGGGTSRQIIGVALLCGIGFTMSLFVGGLAFAEGDHLTGAKLGILLASILAGSGGAFVLLTSGKRAAETAEVG
jgi:NhaA family Na+:H+ antiporter